MAKVQATNGDAVARARTHYLFIEISIRLANITRFSHVDSFRMNERERITQTTRSALSMHVNVYY